MKKCIICGDKFEGYGNNPDPFCNKGYCCNYCNYNIVIPLRLHQALTKMKGGIKK